jgi:hypothetical protein
LVEGVQLGEGDVSVVGFCFLDFVRKQLERASKQDKLSRAPKVEIVVEGH